MEGRVEVGQLVNEGKGSRLQRGSRVIVSRFNRRGGMRSRYGQDERG